MAIFAGNLRIKFSSELFVHPGPWVKKASVISCCRSYQSSGPVMYIPKKCSKNNEEQTSPPTKSSEENCYEEISDSRLLRDKFSKGMRGPVTLSGLREKSLYQSSYSKGAFNSGIVRSNVMVRNIRGFSELENYNYHEMGIIDPNFVEEPEEEVTDEFGNFHEKTYEGSAMSSRKTKQDAEKVAIEALATRAFTAVELRKKLCGKKFPLNIVEGVITDFKSRGLINDFLYAEAFSRSRWSSFCWGPRRIKQALLQKGVNETDAEKAMKLVFEQDDSGSSQELNLGMSKSLLESLFTKASKQWLQGRDVPHETRKSRIIRWLQYRGFNWAVTSYIVKRLESKHPP